jgi:predicted pyridoxine 5'-phosphate oxidase superfamily flavin-nucleotide-binding protein
LVDTGSGVVAAFRIRARGRASGIPVKRDAFLVFTFDDTTIKRIEIFASMSQAVEAAGGLGSSRQ